MNSKRKIRTKFRKLLFMKISKFNKLHFSRSREFKYKKIVTVSVIFFVNCILNLESKMHINYTLISFIRYNKNNAFLYSYS